MSDPRLDRAVHLALLAVAAVTAGMVAAGYTGPLRPLAALVTAALLPGAAVVALLPRIIRAPRPDTATWIMLACAFSLAVETVCALAMVWLRWWRPAPAAAVLGVLAAVILTAHLRRPATTKRPTTTERPTAPARPAPSARPARPAKPVEAARAADGR
ncbi:hypothetical protein [Parafrankia discariae]|uniref:hypothetical protein n=1 Tax=Parafrankia discariae TaxID=365528 RepID=UPI0003641AF5|nr:hypothetical protein [Parafrankia discariae]